MIPECPKGVTKEYKSGWNARLKGKTMNDCKLRIFPWSSYYEFTRFQARIQNWNRGFIACARALGKIRKAERQAEETKQINHEHDMLVELAEELGL